MKTKKTKIGTAQTLSGVVQDNGGGKERTMKKYCSVCGRKVYLRKRGSAEFCNELKQYSEIRNPEYQFWCSKKCYQEYHSLKSKR